MRRLVPMGWVSKTAVRFKACFMMTVVEGSFGLETLSPSQRKKTKPEFGVALMGAKVPWEKLPSPATEPPVPADRESSWEFRKKEAEAERF